MNLGGIYAAIAYALWGVLPVYWKAIQEVPAHEILCHRMVWSLLFTIVLLRWKGRWAWVGAALRSRRVVATFFGSALLIGLNWFTYIWAVNNGFIVGASLGYFITPLINVFLGVVVLREKLRLWQGVAIGVAATGVIYLTFVYGAFPWVGLTLAFSFGFYGLLRKTAPLDALEGLSLETAILFLPAALFLVHLETAGGGAFGHAAPKTTLLLAMAGPATALPLLFFAYGVRRVTLTTAGLLHYIAPTLQFLMGVLVYHEPFTRTRLVGFIVVWIALVIYTWESVQRARRRKRMAGRAGRGLPFPGPAPRGP